MLHSRVGDENITRAFDTVHVKAAVKGLPLSNRSLLHPLMP